MNAGESYSSGAEHKDGPVELEVKIFGAQEWAGIACGPCVRGKS